MLLAKGTNTLIVLAVVCALVTPSRAADPCSNDDAFVQRSVHWTAFCAAIKDAVFDGLSCDDYGLACPLSCGLCDQVADEPACDAAEVRDNKLALAALLNDLGVCPEAGCQAVGVPPSSMVYTERVREGHVIGGYSSLDSLDPCGMWGVTCDRCGAAVDLAIGYPTPFPLQALSPSLFELLRLSVVFLPSTRHSVSDSVPWLDGESWASLSNLTVLALAGDFRGDIPQLSSNQKLSVLRISHAELAGDLNDAVTPSLRAITLHSIFQGRANSTVPLDGKWCEMTELRELSLPAGSLHGTLPECLSDLKMLHEVKLAGNPTLSGSLDILFNSPTTLKTLNVSGCAFTGTVPESLVEHTNLTLLDVSHNQISGAFPDASQLTSLTFLSARSNTLSGAEGTLTGSGMQADFAENEFTQLPAGWFNLHGVASLDLSGNMLTRWPAAGVFPRGILAEDGTLLQCRLVPIEPPFVWPSMRRVSIAGNPLNGTDARSVLGSFGPLESLKQVDISGCGLVLDLPNEGSLLPVISSDCLSNSAEPSFVSLVTLNAADNAISGIHAAPPSMLQQADFSKNSLDTIHEDWFGSSILALSLIDNPSLRVPVSPPPDGYCPSHASGDLVANPRDFSMSLSPLPNVSECTVLCATSMLLQVDSSVNTSALCRCRAGWYGEGMNCVLADVNTWSSSGSLQPTPCPGNSSTNGMIGRYTEDQCQCDTGFFAEFSVQDEMGLRHLKCLPCPPHTLGTGPGALSAAEGCSPCEAGSFAEVGASECELCQLGSVGAGGLGTGCRACEQGHFATEQGQTACTICGVGQYQNSTGATACFECAGLWATTWSLIAQADGTFLQLEGAPSVEHCGCAPGHMFVRDQCQECGVNDLEGLNCPGGVGNDGVVLEPGYYAEFDLVPSVYRCWGDEARCPGYRPMGSSCATDRIGVMCLECDDGMIPESDGLCEECDDSSGGLLHIVVIIIFGGILMLYITMERQTKGMAVTRGFSLLAASVMSLLISCSQQVGVISQMASGWPNPVDWAIETLQFITITVELLQIGCMSGITSLDLFLGKLSMMIFFILIVLTIHIIVVTMMDSTFAERRAVLVSSIGAVLTLFYITVVSVIIAPFKCQLHPNGKLTNRVYQDVTCWESSVHTVMVALAFVALLFPLGYLGLVFWVVQQYPKRVRTASQEFLKSWSFLLVRFKASSYWFAAVMALKNITLVTCSVIPNTFVAMSIAEISLLVSLTLSANQFPFRAQAANYLDILVTFGMVVLGNLGFHERADENYGRKAMSISFTVCLLGGFLLMPVALLARFSVLKLCAVKKYTFFLCHHKAGAGAFARLLKTWLIGHDWVRGDVFLDCDNLENLEDLFTHVKTEVQTLVALSSADLLLRPWCAGEISVSHASKIPVTPIRMADYRELPNAVIEDYAEHVDITPLVEHGIAVENLTSALMWFQKLHGLVLKSLPSKFQMSTITEQLQSLRKVGTPATPIDLTTSPDADSSEASKLCIIVDYTDSETVAASLVLERYLTAVIMLDTTKAAWRPLLLHPKATDIFKEARAAIVVFSVGCLSNSKFLDMLADAAKKRLKAFPVLVQESFRVPTQPEIEEMKWEQDGLARFLVSIFKKIAKLFNAQYASRSVLSLVAEAIAQNFEKSINFRGEAGSKQSPSDRNGVTPLATAASETDATEKRPSMKSPGSMKNASHTSWKSSREVLDDETLSEVDEAGSALEDAKSDSTKLRSTSHHVEEEKFDGGPDYRSTVPFWWWETEC